jgi:hypothetical protein|tara:strand:- start:137 stop:370 length:234 start_codon:yes stop_codon:yes gene_type:complete
MAWLLSLVRAVPALKSILEQLGKIFRNAKADNHVAHAKRDIDAAISRVRDNKPKAPKRKKADRKPPKGVRGRRKRVS